MQPSRKNGHIPTAWQLEHGNLSEDAEVGIPTPESEILRKLAKVYSQIASDASKSKQVFSPATISQDLRVPDHSCHAARGEEPRCSREAPNKAHVRVQLWAHSENTLTWPHDPKKLYLIDHNWINSIIVL